MKFSLISVTSIISWKLLNKTHVINPISKPFSGKVRDSHASMINLSLTRQTSIIVQLLLQPMCDSGSHNSQCLNSIKGKRLTNIATMRYRSYLKNKTINYYTKTEKNEIYLCLNSLAMFKINKITQGLSKIRRSYKI